MKVSTTQEVSSLCTQHLKGRIFNLPEQSGTCKLSIVVPVHNESTKFIKRQIDSLDSQISVEPDKVEVIYIVNNDIVDSSSEYGLQVANANKQVLDMACFKTNMSKRGYRVMVIDASTTGNEVLGCNVGKARNIGLYIAAYRYAARSYNGILMHTDADTFFEDKGFVCKALNIFESDKKLIGATGTRRFIVDTQTADWALVKPVFDQMIAVAKCKAMLAFLVGDVSELTFKDANMFSRAYESVLMGGFKQINFNEDAEFGSDLASFAKQHGLYIKGFKHLLSVTSNFRLSARTGNDATPLAKQLLAGDVPTQQHPITSKLLVLNSNTYKGLRTEVCKLEGGSSFIRYFANIADIRVV